MIEQPAEQIADHATPTHEAVGRIAWAIYTPHVKPAGYIARTLDGIEIRQADGAPFSTPAAAAAALVGILEFAATLGEERAP